MGWQLVAPGLEQVQVLAHRLDRPLAELVLLLLQPFQLGPQLNHLGPEMVPLISQTTSVRHSRPVVPLPRDDVRTGIQVIDPWGLPCVRSMLDASAPSDAVRRGSMSCSSLEEVGHVQIVALVLEGHLARGLLDRALGLRRRLLRGLGRLALLTVVLLTALTVVGAGLALLSVPTTELAALLRGALRHPLARLTALGDGSSGRALLHLLRRRLLRGSLLLRLAARLQLAQCSLVAARLGCSPV